jgi:carbon storage regulator CsrA
MLVLSRKSGEQIVLPQQNVVLTVLEVCGGRVRLGICALENVTIHRQEVLARIQGLTESIDPPPEPVRK